MRVADRIRNEFLGQNAYSDDAFSPPPKTLALIKSIVEFHDRVAEKLKQGIKLDEAMKETGEKSQETGARSVAKA
jgi:V/A-type H+-transporting ATPase subunit A